MSVLEIRVWCTDPARVVAWKKQVEYDLCQCRQNMTDLRMRWHLGTAIFSFTGDFSEPGCELVEKQIKRVKVLVGHASIDIGALIVDAPQRPCQKVM